MSQRFPLGREEKRQALLAAVEGVRAVVTAGADEAEASATLPAATVAALAAAGLFALKLPAVLGGAEADPVTQCEVIEAVSYLDPSAGWCTMIGATGIALPAAFLREEAIEQIFGGNQVPTAAGALMPSGQAVPVDGGYRVSGRWAFASGVRHAQWMTVGARVPQEGVALPSTAWSSYPRQRARSTTRGRSPGSKGPGVAIFRWRSCSWRRPLRGPWGTRSRSVAAPCITSGCPALWPTSMLPLPSGWASGLLTLSSPWPRPSSGAMGRRPPWQPDR
jgi:hypothetical protein